jgi:hypothetical protein
MRDEEEIFPEEENDVFGIDSEEILDLNEEEEDREEDDPGLDFNH